MGVFAALDYYDTDALLTDEERMVRDTVREFVSGEVMPVIEKHNREATFPAQLVPRLAALGVLGPISRRWVSPASARSRTGGHARAGEGRFGAPVLRLGPGLARDVPDRDVRLRRAEGALAPPAASRHGHRLLRPHRARPRLGPRRDDHAGGPERLEWVLNGAKAWITNGTIADVAVVWAKTDDGVRGFLVEKGTPGYSASDIKGKFALRASVTSDLALQDVRVPASSMLPGTRGLKDP